MKNKAALLELAQISLNRVSFEREHKIVTGNVEIDDVVTAFHDLRVSLLTGFVELLSTSTSIVDDLGKKIKASEYFVIYSVIEETVSARNLECQKAILFAATNNFSNVVENSMPLFDKTFEFSDAKFEFAEIYNSIGFTGE